MKTFNELEAKQKKLAVERAYFRLLERIVFGSVKFGDKALQNKIDSALREAELGQVPWFAHEFIMESCDTELRAIAQTDAVRAFYREPGDIVLSLDVH